MMTRPSSAISTVNGRWTARRVNCMSGGYSFSGRLAAWWLVAGLVAWFGGGRAALALAALTLTALAWRSRIDNPDRRAVAQPRLADHDYLLARGQAAQDLGRLVIDDADLDR